jgi:hypothetical protein
VPLFAFLALASVLSPGAAWAATPVTGVSAMTPIASYQGRLVWSRPDATGRFELVQRIGTGAVTRLPVATRGVPFDVDLGPTASGRVFAVYSRCTTEPAPASGLDPEGVRYQSGKGCDVYKLDVASGEEVRYTKVNASDASEFWPTYWKGRLGFARAYDAKPQYPYIYVKDVESSDPSVRMPGGSRGTPSTNSAPGQLELYGTRLGFQWRYATTAGTGTVFELRVDALGGDPVLIDRRVVGLTAILIGWPGFESGRVYWSRGCFGDTGGCTDGVAELRRGTYALPLSAQSAAGPPVLLAHERDAGVTWVLQDTPAPTATQWCGTTATCSIQPLQPAYVATG